MEGKGKGEKGGMGWEGPCLALVWGLRMVNLALIGISLWSEFRSSGVTMLETGLIQALFHWCGTVEVNMHLLNRLVIGCK